MRDGPVEFPAWTSALLGPEAPGLSATSIVRMKEVWRRQYEAWLAEGPVQGVFWLPADAVAVVVNGKYVTGADVAGGADKLFEVVDFLIEKESS